MEPRWGFIKVNKVCTWIIAIAFAGYFIYPHVLDEIDENDCVVAKVAKIIGQTLIDIGALSILMRAMQEILQ